MIPSKLYIVGFMCAGKTTVARALHERILWPDLDLDALIEEREKQSVHDIFAKKGEPYFRRVETVELYKLLRRAKIIVATGGGTFVQEQNRDVMLNNGTVVWLDVPFELVLERLRGDKTRPLAQDLDDPAKVAELHELYKKRLPLYAKAHIQIDASVLEPERIIGGILRVVPTLLPT